MQLGEWRKTAPNRESMSNAVLSVLRPVLSDLGADTDPECWVQWGEDPEVRYQVMVPTRAGLISTAVRVNTGTDGPRAAGKLIRWARLQLSELSLESAGGHRIVAVQVEGQVLKGTDAEADRICEFVRGLIAAVDGRDWQFSWAGATSQVEPALTQRAAVSKKVAATGSARAAAKSATKPGAKPSAKPPTRAAASGSATKAPAAPRTAAPKPAATKPAATKPAASAAQPRAPKPATGSVAKPAAKPAARKRAAAGVPALGPGPATRPVAQPLPGESTRIAPHPIFAPVSTPPSRSVDAEPEDWGDAADDRADREPRRPKTWTP